MNKKINWSNPEEVLEYKKFARKIYGENNKEEIAERDRRYRERNKDKVLAKKKEYREKNKKRILNIAKEYYKNNKDDVRAYKKTHWKKGEAGRQVNKCIICKDSCVKLYCSPKCVGVGRRCEKHYNWRGGPTPYDKNWNDRFKKMIRKRDAYLCAMCDRHQDEFGRSHDVHHMDGDKMNTVKENCITLCRRHHAIVENSGKTYSFWLPRFRKLLTKLYGYNYVEVKD